jgi:hypothetical protein
MSMTDQQIRSADLLVKTALSDPKTVEALRANPEETLKALAVSATQNLPRVELPTARANDAIWIIIICAFALVMLGSAYVLGSTVTSELKTGATYVTKGETILTVFTTVVAFLAGLLSPSPLKQ